jgi:hypothetical protein
MKNFLLLFLIAIFCLCDLHEKTWKGTLKMPPDIEIDSIIDSTIPIPIIFPSPDKLMTDIFAVPRDGAIGTNWLNNAITIMHLENDGIKYEEVKRDFLGQVAGGDPRFIPVFDDNWIGYSQTRGFLIFNLKTGEYIDHIIGKNLGETIEKVAIIDGPKKKFIMEIEYLADNNAALNGLRDTDGRFLRIFDLSGELPVQVAELEIPFNDISWNVSQNKIWLLNPNGNIQIYDFLFKKINEHPFLKEYTKFSKFYKRVDQLFVHPSLPFAIINGLTITKQCVTSIASWRDPQKPSIVPAIGLKNDAIFTYVGFSPDGKWLVGQGRSPKTAQGDKKSYYYAFPLSEKNPLYLGDPKCLGKFLEKNHDDPFSEQSACWTTKPLSYVATTGNIIYQWIIE